MNVRHCSCLFVVAADVQPVTAPWHIHDQDASWSTESTTSRHAHNVNCSVWRCCWRWIETEHQHHWERTGTHRSWRTVWWGRMFNGWWATGRSARVDDTRLLASQFTDRPTNGVSRHIIVCLDSNSLTVTLYQRSVLFSWVTTFMFLASLRNYDGCTDV